MRANTCEWQRYVGNSESMHVITGACTNHDRRSSSRQRWCNGDGRTCGHSRDRSLVSRGSLRTLYLESHMEKRCVVRVTIAPPHSTPRSTVAQFTCQVDARMSATKCHGGVHDAYVQLPHRLSVRRWDPQSSWYTLMVTATTADIATGTAVAIRTGRVARLWRRCCWR